MKKYADVDEFLANASQWRAEMVKLRTLLKGEGLSESIKWGKPCFSHGDNNVAILQPMNDFLALMFFKGALIEDSANLLEEQGKNTRSARRVCFTSVGQVKQYGPKVRDFVRQAIAIEDEGRQLPEAPKLVLVEELQARLKRDKVLRAAFDKLTPGRQREYHLFISGAKQPKTREARIDKHVDRIKAGKGLRDR